MKTIHRHPPEDMATRMKFTVTRLLLTVLLTAARPGALAASSTRPTQSTHKADSR